MPDPRWRQIAEELRHKIESRELGPGAALPSELELQESYGASRNTVRDAIRWLVARGLVVTRPGRGTFIARKIDPFVTPLETELQTVLGSESATYLSEVEASKRQLESSVPRVEVQQASTLVAAELDIPAGEAVVSRHQERHIDGTPWSLQTTFYPMRLVQDGAVNLLLANDLKPGAVPYVQDVLGIEQVGWRERLVVRVPDRRETEFFDLNDDGRVAVIETIRTGYDENQRPFRVTVTSFPADRNQFVLTVGKAPATPPAALTSEAETQNRH
jgi:GntR family transcriptional regulator